MPSWTGRRDERAPGRLATRHTWPVDRRRAGTGSRRLLSALLLALMTLAGCGGPAPVAVRSAVAHAVRLTEAARTAHFRLVFLTGPHLTIETGVVDFAKEEAEFSVTGQAAPQPPELSWVAGTTEYDCSVGSPGGPEPGTSTTMYPLGALAFPLLAADGQDRATDLGHRQLGGTITTEYLLEAPASFEALGSIHVHAHSVELWLDSHGRIREVSYTELLTVPGGAAAGPRSTTGTYGERLSLSDFGAPVSITLPGRKYPAAVP